MFKASLCGGMRMFQRPGLRVMTTKALKQKGARSFAASVESTKISGPSRSAFDPTSPQTHQGQASSSFIPSAWEENQVTVSGVTLTKGPFNSLPVTVVEHPTLNTHMITHIMEVRGEIQEFKRFWDNYFPLSVVKIYDPLRRCSSNLSRELSQDKQYHITIEGDHREEVKRVLKKAGF